MYFPVVVGCRRCVVVVVLLSFVDRWPTTDGRRLRRVQGIYLLLWRARAAFGSDRVAGREVVDSDAS